MASINEGLFAGRAGIQSHGAAISVLSDNIANANTVGFKSSRAEFVDLLAGNISGSGSATAVGSGSSVANVTQIFTQGSFEYTGRGLDLAIDGNGFFIVEDPSGARFYSRAGNFSIDADGNLLNQNGNNVMGFPVNGTGGLELLNINDISTTSQPTSNVKITGNLDASTALGTGDPYAGNLGVHAATPTFDFVQQDAAYSTFLTVYDSLGKDHTLNIFFFQSGTPNQWEVGVYVDAAEVGGTPGEAYRLGGMSTADASASPATGGSFIEFLGDGKRASVGSPDFTLNNIPWSNGSNSSNINMTFDPYTQFSTASNISSLIQDGSGSGNVVSFNVETDGTLFATLDNGESANVGQIALATFGNPEALRRTGESLFSESQESGQPVIGTAQSGKFGAIESGAIELSTSDIASDFIKLITLQRGFQGSSRIISNIDDLLNEIINLA